ncbi:hypothetical protein C1T31_11685 [Hanstruepera neustonica]|uniref:DUF4199 domain-containing protein n=1 Tax=Hanstruepera neustonica TaxID=1445657 RepID=A0A2K1DWM8_9FLAO|nr:DUF4199 domain-containing protein [Hanstruepera neustonica]PNQ72447.1 hypothetical protein C1T31_11685 [Hanstruepera neustonica]
MENNTTSIKPFAYNYGLYLGALSIIMLVIMYIFEIDKSWPLSITSIALTITIYVIALRAFKNANNGQLKLGQAMKLGLAMAVIGGLVSAIYSYVHYSMIYPEFIENIRDESVKQMLERSPDMTNEQIEQASKINNMFTSPFAMSTFSLIGSLFFGIIISLIAGLIMKSDD